MITILALLSSAFALDVDLQVAPAQGEPVWVTFHDVTPGATQVVDLPCAQAPSCRLSVNLAPEGDQWLISVKVFEVHHPLFGEERLLPVSSPTFLAPTGQTAEMFIGSERPIPGSQPLAYQQSGLHIQARVRVPT